jgi:hypothetical protein
MVIPPRHLTFARVRRQSLVINQRDVCSLDAGKKSSKKTPPPPPPVGAWIHKLHLADNGIDVRGRGDTVEFPGQSAAIILHTCLQMFAQ